jgi:putative glutathione S-transferase
MVLSMKGLWSASITQTAPVVGVSIVHPTWARTRPNDTNDLHRGWQFVDPTVTEYVTAVNGCGRFSSAGCTADAVHGFQFVRDLYNLADPSDAQGKYTVPILWDTKRNTIVNNESSEILRMFNEQFNAFSTVPTLDLYPQARREEIDAINQWTYEINNGVYKCGFATSQEAYDEAEAHLYAMLGSCASSLSFWG